MHIRKTMDAGLPLGQAKRALIMIHGRGATAEDILSLHQEFGLHDFYITAPQATNYTWYPYSFMAPVMKNEPWLSGAVDVLSEIVADITKAGIPVKNIFILGFSQGACLALEFATRFAQPWGGVIAFTGGLIGDVIDSSRYHGNFTGTNVFIGTSDIDSHVPLERCEKSAELIERLGARVTLKVYHGMGHTINADEITRAAHLLTHEW
jgi:phospholipase/carboxylesterase